MFNNKLNEKCTFKSKIPVPISRQKVIVTLAKLEKNKNSHRLFSSTCSRRAQEEENFKLRSKKKTYEKTQSFQKPEKIQLKEDLEKLRRKQKDEIIKLKQQVLHKKSLKRKQEFLRLQTEIQKELLEKQKLQKRLSFMATEKQKLNTQLIDLLEVKSSPINKNSDQLKHLKAELQKNKDEFQTKLQAYQQLLEQKETFIQEQQTKKEQLIEHHQHQLRQIHQDFSARMKQLESQHKVESTTKPKISQAMINQLVEQVLKDFEQEQHHHPQEHTPVTHLTLKTGRYHPVNQQWYSQKYIPFNAMSWPTPPSHKNITTISN